MIGRFSAALAALFVSASALAGTITFDADPVQPPGTSFAFPQYTENGFVVKAPGPIPTSPPYQLARNGGGIAACPENGTTYLHASFSSKVEIFAANGAAFRATSVDLAEYSTVFAAPYVTDVTFIGTTVAGDTVTFICTLDGFIDGTGPAADFQTWVLPDDFKNLVKLEVQGTVFAMDNLVADIQLPDAVDDTFHVPVSALDNLPVLANDSSSLCITKVTQGANGDVFKPLFNPAGKTVRYVPRATYQGNDTFTYTVTDSAGLVDTATVALVNANPICSLDSASLHPGESILVPVLANDTDADGDTLSLEAVNFEAPLGGVTVVIEGGALRITAAPTAFGPVSCNYTAIDSYGGYAQGQALVFVRPPTVTIASLFAKGGPVPTVSFDDRIASGSVWVGFGPPAINDQGKLAFIGRWRPPSVPGARPPTEHAGVFVNGLLLLEVGERMPRSPVALPPDATFKSFQDPVIDGRGGVAFLATIAGKGVTTANRMVVVSTGREYRPVPEVLARTGDPAPGTGGLLFQSFGSVSIQSSQHSLDADVFGPGRSESGTVFTAMLRSNSALKVTAHPWSNRGAWWLSQGGTEVTKLAQTGDPVGDSTIRSFKLLDALGSSAGQGRGQSAADQALLQISLTNGEQQIACVRLDDSFTAATTGASLQSSTLPEASWSRLALPASSHGARQMAVLGSLLPSSGGVTAADARGIFETRNAGLVWEPLARTLDPAPGFGAGAHFLSFRDPVHSSTQAAVAFLATAGGGRTAPTGGTGIWSWSETSGELTLVARTGGKPPSAGLPPAARWQSFPSIALPGNGLGPLFTGVVKPGSLGRTSDLALYAVDSAGGLRELLRQNQTLLGKRIRSFHALKAVPGSPGVTRTFNTYGQIATLVTFMDGSTSLVRIDVP